ncbi:MAG: T9SS type A sorting domain-containing protein, partial [Bacteroidetes bacterium]|nr:T9SS type A sorting domain-containing protein [Bacteroidota bacterium]
NYPNPFNPTATIEYDLPISIFVKLSVFDILGREIAILVNENRSVGKYSVTFDTSNLPAGIYFYRMQAGEFQETRKLVLLK